MRLVNCYRIVLFTTLSLSPLFFWPASAVVHEVPKVWLVLGLIELFALITILRITTGGKVNKLVNIWPVLVFVLVAFVTSALGADFRKSFFGNFYRLDGLITLIHLIAFALSVALFARKKDIEIAFLGFVIGTAILSVWAVWDFLLTGSNPVSISFGNPNFLGGYLAVTAPFLVYFFAKAKTKGIKSILLLVFLIQIVAVLLTHSIGAILTMGFGLFVYFWYKRGKKAKLFLGVLLLFAVAFYLWNLLNYAPGIDLVYEGRQRIILKTLSGVDATNRYLFGFGVANVDYAFDAGVWPLPVYGDVYLDKAHSTLLESFLTTGFVGLASYLILLFVVLKTHYIRSKKIKINRVLFFVPVLYLVHAQTNVISISEELLFWFAVGVSVIES